MDISVVVPVLNEADYVAQCLQALQDQTLARERYEILVVDNGSTDGSPDIVSGFLGVELLREPRRDAYIARNRGVEAARGSILAFTDADCAPEPDWLERLIVPLSQPDVSISIGRLVYPPDSTRGLRAYADYYDTKAEWIFERPIPECFFGHGGNMAIRRSVFDRVGRFDRTPIVGDTEIIHRLLEAVPSAKVRYARDATVTHLEVTSLRRLLTKLRDYGRYNRAVSDVTRYRPLSVRERFSVLSRCIRRYRYSPLQIGVLLGTLSVGLVAFELGRHHVATREGSCEAQKP